MVRRATRSTLLTYTTLLRCRWVKNEAVMQLLIEERADVTAREKDGTTVLHRAAEGGNEKAVRLLLEKGADVTVKDRNGETVLHKAAGRWDKNEAEVQLFIEK